MISVYETFIDSNKKPQLICIKSVETEKSAFSMYDTALVLKDDFYMDVLADEHVYLVCFDDLLDIVGIFPIAIGDYNSCKIYNRKIVNNIVLTGATRYAVFHNHPNQISQPSTEDISSAALLEAIGNLIQTEFLGSYIITQSGWLKVEQNITIHLWDEEEREDAGQR